MKNCEKRLAVLQQIMNIVVTRNTSRSAIEFQTRKYGEYRQFLYGENETQNWSTANEAYLSMTCKPVGDENWMVPYECTLGLCKNCPPLPTVQMEDSRIGNNSIGMVTYRENCIVYYCEKHNAHGFHSKCIMCANDNLPAAERPRIQSKDTVVFKKLTVGEFKSTIYAAQLRTCSQHRFVRKVLGKTWSLGQRETMLVSTLKNLM